MDVLIWYKYLLIKWLLSLYTLCLCTVPAAVSHKSQDTGSYRQNWAISANVHHVNMLLHTQVMKNLQVTLLTFSALQLEEEIQSTRLTMKFYNTRLFYASRDYTLYNFFYKWNQHGLCPVFTNEVLVTKSWW